MVQTSPFRVLIASSNRFLAEDMYQVLTSEGYDVFLADTSEEAENLALRLRPDLIIIDVQIPPSGYELCRQLRTNTALSHIPVLMLIDSRDISARVAVLEAGGDDYLVKPFPSDELLYRSRSLLVRYRSGPTRQPITTSNQGRVMVFFGSKGGVGTTTIAVNCAIAIHQVTRKPVLLLDADLHLGDVSVQLDLSAPPDITHLLRLDELTPLHLQEAIQHHMSGIHVLLAPPDFQEARAITPDQLTTLINFLSTVYDYIIVDSRACFDDRNLALLSRADEIFLTLTPEVSPIRNTSAFLRLAEQIGIPLNAVHLVLNRANSNRSIGLRAVERHLNTRVEFWLVSSGQVIVRSLTQGVPMIISQPSHPFSEQIVQMARTITAPPASSGSGAR